MMLSRKWEQGFFWQQNLERFCLVGALLISLGPLLALILKTINEVLWTGTGWLPLSFNFGQRGVLLLQSIALSMGTSVVATALAWVAAVQLWVYHSRASSWLGWVAIPLAALPPYLHAMAWLATSAAAGKITRVLGFWSIQPSGWGSALWVQCAAYMPIAFGCAWLGLRAIDPDLVDAARLGRSDLSTLLRMVLPLCFPALLTGGGIIFLFSLLDYSVPSLLQVHTTAMEILVEFTSSGSTAQAFLAALPLVLLASGVLVAFMQPLRSLSFQPRPQQSGWGNPPYWPIPVGWLFGLAAGVVILQAVLPFAVMSAMSGGIGKLAGELEAAGSEIALSLSIAVSAGLISLPFALAAARALLRTGRLSGLIWFLFLLPLAIPGSLTGISLVPLAGLFPGIQILLPIFAALARFLPLAIMLLAAQLRLIDPLLFQSASVFQPSFFRRAVVIYLPLLAPGLLAGAGLVAALTLGELCATLLVIPPGQSTLVLRIYNYLHYGATDTVARLCLALALSVLFVGGGVAGISAIWVRLTAIREGEA